MPKRIIRITILTLLVLVGCSFAVWEILIFVQNDQPKIHGGISFVDKEAEMFRMNDTGAISPIELMQKSEKTTVLFRELLSDPPVVPPKGAKLIRAVGRRAIRDGYVELQWSYEISDDEKATISYYNNALKKEGFVLRSKKRKAQRVGMLFYRYPVLVTLSLRPATKKGFFLNVLNVTVCENRPERSGDFKNLP